MPPKIICFLIESRGGRFVSPFCIAFKIRYYPSKHFFLLRFWLANGCIELFFSGFCLFFARKIVIFVEKMSKTSFFSQFFLVVSCNLCIFAICKRILTPQRLRQGNYEKKIKKHHDDSRWTTSIPIWHRSFICSICFGVGCYLCRCHDI